MTIIVIALVGAGLWVGSLVRGSAIDRLIPDRALAEVHLENGTVYLGAASLDGRYVVLDRPAVVVPEAAAGETTRYVVEPLSRDPYSIAGPILIERERVAFIGAVLAGSGIDSAYQQALAADSESMPSPS